MSDALTTKERVKERLQIAAGTTTWDDLLDRIILAVTKRMSQMCNRRFNEATFTNELYDGSDLYGTRRSTLIVKNAPISTISSVQYKTGLNSNPTWVSYDEDDYDVDEEAGLLYFKSPLPRGRQNIRITYTGGFADNSPADLSEVAEEAVVRVFKRRESEGRSSETFQESQVTWRENVFTKEDLATIKNYRRGNVI